MPSKKYYLFIFLFCFSIYHLKAQEKGLKADKVFFYHTALPEFENWLNASHLKQLLKVEKLAVKENSLDLYLSSPLSDKELIATWENFKNKFYRNYEREFSEYLFSHYCFQMEVGKDSARIFILGENPNAFAVEIFYNEYRVDFKESIQKAMGSGTRPIPIEDLKSVYRSSSNTVSKQDVKKIRDKIINYLTKHYEKLEAGYLEYVGFHSEVEYITEGYTKFNVYAWDFSDEVVEDGFFEYLLWEFEILPEADELKIKYNFYAKYGSGIFKSPRKSEYKNREPKWAEEVKQYEKSMMTDIEKIITE